MITTIASQHLTPGTTVVLALPVGHTAAQARARLLLTIAAEHADDPTHYGMQYRHVSGSVKAEVTDVSATRHPLTGQQCYTVTAVAQGGEYRFTVRADHHVRTLAAQ